DCRRFVGCVAKYTRTARGRRITTPTSPARARAPRPRPATHHRSRSRSRGAAGSLRPEWQWRPAQHRSPLRGRRSAPRSSPVEPRAVASSTRRAAAGPSRAIGQMPRAFCRCAPTRQGRRVRRLRSSGGVEMRQSGAWPCIEPRAPSSRARRRTAAIGAKRSDGHVHDVLDEWFVRDVKPALAGQAELFRFAADAVALFATREDAERFLAVLPKRFGKFGLTLHPGKTRMVPFRRPDRVDHDDDHPGTFNFLGFTHYWGLSRKPTPKGRPVSRRWIAKRKTAKDRVSRTLRRLYASCRWHRHDTLETQHLMLVKKLRGHYEYYGVTGNFPALAKVYHRAERIWQKALARRSQRRFTWSMMQRILERFP